MTVMTLNPLPYRLHPVPLVWGQMDLHSLTLKGYHRGIASEDSITSRRQWHKAAAANQTTQTRSVKADISDISASLPAHLQLGEYGSTQAVQ